MVPQAAATPPGFAATWTGIGGYSTSDLIQAGISENSAPNNGASGNQYAAWYELLPAAETSLTHCTGASSCPVKPGDDVAVAITQVSKKKWLISVADSTESWTWSKTVKYSSSQSSAEWILEAPTVGAQTTLANVGTVHFGPTSTYTVGGQTSTIAQGDPTEIILTPGGVDEATPSAIANDGQSFNDCRVLPNLPGALIQRRSSEEPVSTSVARVRTKRRSSWSNEGGREASECSGRVVEPDLRPALEHLSRLGPGIAATPRLLYGICW